MTTQTLTINFNGTDLFIVEHNGQPYTPMKTIVEGMGLAWQPQLAKLNANPERWGITKIVIPTLGDMQEAVCMPLRKLFGWLAGIYPNKVKPELRDTIIKYQNECDNVLWEHWNKKQEAHISKQLPEPLTITESEAQQFKKSIEHHCKHNSAKYSELYRLVYDYFGITTYKNIPAGKLLEASKVCGMALMPLSKPKLKALPPTLTRTEIEAIIDSKLKANAIEAVPVSNQTKDFHYGKQCIEALRKMASPEALDLLRELDECLISAYTHMDESIFRLHTVLMFQKRWRGCK